MTKKPIGGFLADIVSLPELRVGDIVYPGSPFGKITLGISYQACREGQGPVEKAHQANVQYFKIRVFPTGSSPFNIRSMVP